MGEYAKPVSQRIWACAFATILRVVLIIQTIIILLRKFNYMKKYGLY